MISNMDTKKVKKQPARILYWFRTDLRTHDSPALQAALNLEQDVGIEAFYPVRIAQVDCRKLDLCLKTRC
jgi:deoxyribodipyrimidine photolyase